GRRNRRTYTLGDPLVVLLKDVDMLTNTITLTPIQGNSPKKKEKKEKRRKK
ncbi:MAG: hypothetical protein JNJ47_03400, partial [Alphaproteobacteria bacterium]|nr:hypothetical protein [Alphaproteobacteria bacterium]